MGPLLVGASLSLTSYIDRLSLRPDRQVRPALDSDVPRFTSLASRRLRSRCFTGPAQPSRAEARRAVGGLSAGIAWKR